MEIWPGTAYPLGATYDGSGVNFAVFSEVAHAVELCLLDDTDGELTEQRIATTDLGIALINASIENGRYKRTIITPTLFPSELR